MMMYAADVSSYAPRYRDTAAELLLARALAAAANSISTNGPVQLSITATNSAEDAPQRKRAVRDAFLLCMDRAAARVYPPLDPLQYLTGHSPHFTDDTETGKVIFEIHPTASFVGRLHYAGLGTPSTENGESLVPRIFASHSVEGVAVRPETFAVRRSRSKSSCEADASPHHYVAGGNLTGDEEFFLQVQQASHRHRGTAPETEVTALSSADQKKLRVMYWRLACWLADRYVNEASWARPLSTVARGPSAPGRGVHHQSSARGSRSSAPGAGAKFKSVIDAAVAAAPQAPPKPGRHGTNLGVREQRVVHSDVRGMEFVGTIVACTRRYAYVAVPFTAHRGAAELWSLVSRVPVPSWLSDKIALSMQAGKGSAVACGGKPRFCNLSDAIRHDDSGSLVELSEAERVTVTVMAHRVHCRVLDGASAAGEGDRRAASAVSPARFSVWFDDAYLITVHRALGTMSLKRPRTGEEGGDEADVVTLDLFSDIVGLLRESCSRYLRVQARMAGYRAAAASAARRSPTAVTTESDEVVTTVSDEVTGPASKSAELLVSQGKLVSSAEVVFAAVSDTMSVHFKKARGAGSGGNTPVANTCAAISSLCEGCTVEFKWGLRVHGQHDAAVMDTERIRHTISAMASTRGGVIAVGVRDDGVVVGHAPGLVAQNLRVSGFCPAMVKDAVVVREIRVLESAAVTSDDAAKGAATSSAAKMPANWWKSPTQQSTTTPAEASKVVTVITVTKGQAPFYAATRGGTPYIRGCASTTKMSMLVIAARLLNHLVVGA